MKFKFFIVLLVLMTVQGCANTAPVATQSKSNAPIAQYYATYEGITEQQYPETDWPYVTDMNNTEPTTTVIRMVWVDYDQNVFTINSVNILTGEMACLAFLMEDVSVVVTESWKETGRIYNYLPIDCAVVAEGLVKALEKGKI